MSNVLKKIIGLKAEQLDDLVNDRLVIDGETKTYDELNSLYVVNVNEETGEVDLSGFATEDWVKSAHQTIDSITSQDDGFDILYSTGAEMTLPIRAEDGIVVDVTESGDYIVVHLEDTFLNNINKAAKALVTPVTTPTEFELVGISTANSQQRVRLGEGLSYEAGELKVTGGGTKIYRYVISGSYGDPFYDAPSYDQESGAYSGPFLITFAMAQKLELPIFNGSEYATDGVSEDRNAEKLLNFLPNYDYYAMLSFVFNDSALFTGIPMCMTFLEYPTLYFAQTQNEEAPQTIKFSRYRVLEIDNAEIIEL